MKTHPFALLGCCLGLLSAPDSRADLNVQYTNAFATGGTFLPEGLTIDIAGNGWITSVFGLYGINSGGKVTLLSTAAYGSATAAYGVGAFYADKTTLVQRYNLTGSATSTLAFPDIASPTVDALATSGTTLFTVGESTFDANPHSFLTKSNAFGTRLWTTTFGTTFSNIATGLALDPAGNSYIAGWTYGTFPGQTKHGRADAYVIKIDPNGAPLWQTQFGTGYQDFANALITDSLGNTYVTGQTSHTDIGPDAFLTKLDPNGVPLWTKTIDRLGADEGQAITLDSLGNIWIGGYSASGYPTTSATLTNPFLAEYSPDGTLLGTHYFPTGHGGTIRALAPGHFGGVIAVGYAEGLLYPYTKGETEPFIANVVPEPTSCALLLSAVGTLGLRRRRSLGRVAG